jgi:[ribosomal protein S5]-alanine N-acetyltransferase
MRTLSSTELTLEPQLAAHADAMFAVLSDPAIYEYENAPPSSVEWLRMRFQKLETRQSSDGSQLWLNWVIRLPSTELIGYVQATVYQNATADIAYELSSAHWGKGLASKALVLMLAELVDHYQVDRYYATLKQANHRSARLLLKFGFRVATDAERGNYNPDADELLMTRIATNGL